MQYELCTLDDDRNEDLLTSTQSRICRNERRLSHSLVFCSCNKMASLRQP